MNDLFIPLLSTLFAMAVYLLLSDFMPEMFFIDKLFLALATAFLLSVFLMLVREAKEEGVKIDFIPVGAIGFPSRSRMGRKTRAEMLAEVATRKEEIRREAKRTLEENMGMVEREFNKMIKNENEELEKGEDQEDVSFGEDAPERLNDMLSKSKVTFEKNTPELIEMKKKYFIANVLASLYNGSSIQKAIEETIDGYKRYRPTALSILRMEARLVKNGKRAPEEAKGELGYYSRDPEKNDFDFHYHTYYRMRREGYPPELLYRPPWPS